MVEFFSRLFVKDHQNTQDKNVRAAYGKMTAIVGVVTNLLLALGKLLLGLLSASLSVIADAVNNLSDAGSSLISFVGVQAISASPEQSTALESVAAPISSIFMTQEARV